MNFIRRLRVPRLNDKGKWVVCVTGGVLTCGFAYALEHTADASDFVVHPFQLPWSHGGLIDSLDMASVRRGYEVYKQVCAACHSMQYIRYRHFVNNFMSEDEAKAEAAEIEVDFIDDKGVPAKRPGLLNDFLPSPYPNKQAAEAANNGAEPPDLSLMGWARDDGDNYVFHLLTGYGFDPPEGVLCEEGKAYNPYFPNGSVLAMPQQLFDEGIEYKDGTPATMSQQAKDVVTYLRWACEQWHDKRKQYAIKLALLIPIVSFVLVYWKRKVWTQIKSEKWFHRTVKGREWTPDSKFPPPPKDAPSLKRLN
uniref:Cytochrome c domain-containing protein n=1 Tax=Meloidogyne enterolobii TaxID=390850 RepID=A0A6V7X123_MELEN|nr:unnamed protein product [Meloidogyne enterolobii]CAD2193011.1 unnamed protein product [Meloidogyne enterolobii]